MNLIIIQLIMLGIALIAIGFWFRQTWKLNAELDAEAQRCAQLESKLELFRELLDLETKHVPEIRNRIMLKWYHQTR
jgi:hypothetical protein